MVTFCTQIMILLYQWKPLIRKLLKEIPEITRALASYGGHQDLIKDSFTGRSELYLFPSKKHEQLYLFHTCEMTR
jgi:hypothetical protein